MAPEQPAESAKSGFPFSLKAFVVVFILDVVAALGASAVVVFFRLRPAIYGLLGYTLLVLMLGTYWWYFKQHTARFVGMALGLVPLVIFILILLAVAV